MGLELRQSLKLTQQLVMTPQLQQAIKLLQMSRVELLDMVQQELLENPLLEEKEEHREEESREPAEKEKKSEEFQELNTDDQSLIRNADWEDYLGDFSSTAKQTQLREREVPEEVMSYEGRLAKKPSLEGHLLWQIRLSNLTDEEQQLAENIIGNLSSNGYLRIDLQELADESNFTIEHAEQVLQKIQQFDPVGIACRTPQECLTVQLKFYGEQDPILYEIVEQHLEDIEKRRFKPLLRKFKIDIEDLKTYLEILQRLDPMPGGVYGKGDTVYVSPDVYIYEYEGEFLIVLNEDGLPSLQLSPYYLESNISKNKGQEGEYVNDKMRSALWLMKSLQQRQRTLYKVSESIIRFQNDFFRKGVSKLKPLILKDVAEDIGMHESTVSRITSNKYMATPHGIFELKFFFNSALDLGNGSQVGSESVKDAIKKMIAGENSAKPLSDEKIAATVKEELGVTIARRTVAKYRSALNIPSSSKRKKLL